MEKKNVVSFRSGDLSTLDLEFAGTGETTAVMVGEVY